MPKLSHLALVIGLTYHSLGMVSDFVDFSRKRLCQTPLYALPRSQLISHSSRDMNSNSRTVPYPAFCTWQPNVHLHKTHCLSCAVHAHHATRFHAVHMDSYCTQHSSHISDKSHCLSCAVHALLILLASAKSYRMFPSVVINSLNHRQAALPVMCRSCTLHTTFDVNLTQVFRKHGFFESAKKMG